MDKIAIVTDVHGNLPALISVLEDIQDEQCDRIYNLGDAIAIGAYPNETLDLMLKEKAIMLMGNHEGYYLSSMLIHPSNMTKGEIEHQKWISRELDLKYKKIISQFPVMLSEQINGFNIGFMHYPIDSGTTAFPSFKEIKKDLQKDNIDSFFQLEGYDIIFFGHHHPFFDCYGANTGTRYINPGALGCQVGIFSNYCILEINKNEYQIKHKRVKYDKHKAIEALYLRNVPERDFIKRNFYGVK